MGRSRKRDRANPFRFQINEAELVGLSQCQREIIIEIRRCEFYLSFRWLKLKHTRYVFQGNLI